MYIKELIKKEYFKLFIKFALKFPSLNIAIVRGINIPVIKIGTKKSNMLLSLCAYIVMKKAIKNDNNENETL